jgi:hypothetical protein
LDFKELYNDKDENFNYRKRKLAEIKYEVQASVPWAVQVLSG